MDPLQTLIEAVRCLQCNEIDDCVGFLRIYREWRAKGGFEPTTQKHSVTGDKIAEALRTLIDSRLYPY